jgi:hypothetical protein
MTGRSEEKLAPPPYLHAALMAVAVLLIYVVTLAPTTAFWDASEYIAAAYVLGIPHPPGNPLFTLLAHTFGALPLSPHYAVRINLFAAVTSATSAGLWFLVADRWMRNVVPVRWARLAAAAAGTLVSATCWTVWNQSTVNEKVYTVSMLSTALVMWLGVHWADDRPGSHRDRWVILIAYVMALSSTNHLMGVLAAPAVGIYILWTDWRVLTRWPVLVGVAVAVLVGISLNYIYLPIRAGQYPPINEGEPVGFFSNALFEVLNRAQYGKPSAFTERQADLLAQMGNYVQYFHWQWARDWGPVRRIVTVLFSLIGFNGVMALWRHDKRAATASTVMMVTVTVALVWYLNFKYGFSYPVDPAKGDVAREVRERDYFFVVSFAFFGVWVAVGLGALMQTVVEFLGDRGTPQGRWAMATPVLALGLIPLLGNSITAPRSHETMARDLAADLLESVEPYGVLITAGDNDTFPLWYAQEVEGIRPDVTLANLSLMNTRWHLKQLARRKTPTFDPSKAAPIWRSQQPKAPTTPALRLSMAQIDSLPEVQSLSKATSIRFDSLTISLTEGYLTLQDLATMFLIRDNIGQRPIYFSWSDGGYPDQTLGLTPYLVTTGLVRKLEWKPVAPKDSILVNRSLGFMNLPRTEKLMWEVYHWRTAARTRPRGWVDAPSASILSLYSVVFSAGGSSLRDQGDSVAAARADSVARAVTVNVSPALR